MNAKEKYNATIGAVEEMANDETELLTAREIADRIAEQNGLSLRDMSNIISFLTGDTLMNYIKERKLQAAYAYLVQCSEEQRGFDVNTAIALSGYDNQSSFTKRFREAFDMTPREAYFSGGRDKISSVKDWDYISKEFEDMQDYEERNMPTLIFGIDQEQYAKAMRAADLQALYGLTNEASNAAFELAAKYDLPLEETFEYISELGITEVDDEDKELIESPEYMYGFFDCSLSIELTEEAMDRLGDANSITDYDATAIYIFAHLNDVAISFCVKAAEYYRYHYNDNYDDNAFEAYIDLLGKGHPIEVAFELAEGASDAWIDNLTPNDIAAAYDAALNPKMHDEEYELMEKWAEKNMGVGVRHERFDEEYDAENAAFDEYDASGPDFLDF